MNEIDQTTVRGVENPRVVDLISAGPGDAEVTFLIQEQRPWGSVAEQLEQLQEKFNNYLDYIIDGYFLSHYPQYRGRQVVIRLECVSSPGEQELSLFNAIEHYLRSTNMTFHWVLSPNENPLKSE